MLEGTVCSEKKAKLTLLEAMKLKLVAMFPYGKCCSLSSKY